jgi:hypothetical protein
VGWWVVEREGKDTWGAMKSMLLNEARFWFWLLALKFTARGILVGVSERKGFQGELDILLSYGTKSLLSVQRNELEIILRFTVIYFCTFIHWRKGFHLIIYEPGVKLFDINRGKQHGYDSVLTPSSRSTGMTPGSNMSAPMKTVIGKFWSVFGLDCTMTL